MKRKNNIFPNTNIPVAYYDQFIQYIRLCEVSQKEFSELKGSQTISERSNLIYSTYTHELTHWLDHTTTLWGQKNLNLLYNALNARVTNRTEEFWRIKYYDDYCKSETLQDYYTTIDKPNSNLKEEGWSLQKYYGARFDISGKSDETNPMFFVKFVDAHQEQIARIPITVASLLECRATHFEFLLRSDTIGSFYLNSKKDIGTMRLNKDFYQTIFSPELLLYTVIGYLTMFKFDSRDLRKIYSLSSTISNISLNFPNSLLSQIKRITKKEPKVGYFQDQLISNCDRGFLFYTMLHNCRDLDLSKEITVDAILNCSNLPNEEEFKSLIIIEMVKTQESLIKGPFEKDYKRTISKGIEIFNKSKLDDMILKKTPYTDRVFCPKLSYSDSNPASFELNANYSLSELALKEDKTFEEHYLLYREMEIILNEFVEACSI